MVSKKTLPLDLPLPERAKNNAAPATREMRAISQAETQEFFIPVSGFVRFYKEEQAIIDHPAFQRLGKINQLGQAHYVYRGATHKRYEHVLGVVHVVQKIISALELTCAKGRLNNDQSYAPMLSESEERFVRLGALLHDIGHLAAGHTLEDELQIVGKHDEDKRISLLFKRRTWEGDSFLSLEEVIDREFEKFVPDDLRDKVTPSNIARLLIRKPAKPDDDFKVEDDLLKSSSSIRHRICSNMIANTICADLLDYIYRDWYHVGKTRSFDDRIFQYMELRRQDDDHSPNLEEVTFKPDERSPDDRFVIALGKEARIKTDGISAILNLLEWRYELAEAVLFHRTKVAAGAMLDRALFDLWSNLDEDQIVSKILDANDDQLLDIALEEANKKAGDNAGLALNILRKLKRREIYKVVEVFDTESLLVGQAERAKALFFHSINPKDAARNRSSAARGIEIDFELPPGSVVLYCAEARAKIAEVTVAVDDNIVQLNKYDEQRGKPLTGGHLGAQVERFKQLWRMQFFIDGKQLDMLRDNGRLNELQRVLKQIVLGSENKNQLNEIVKQFAKARCLDGNGRPVNAVRFRAELPDVAKGDASVFVYDRYPNGAPLISSFLEKIAEVQ